MFGKRAFQISLVKTSPQNSSSKEHVTEYHIDPTQLSELIKDQVRHTAIIVGTALTVRTVLNTASEIALITAKAKIR